ncbi:MAG TPA: N-acetyltransferase family protein [Candidatus Obscuribacterales bacterium]
MTIRLASAQDAKAIRKIYEAYISTPITFELQPPAVEEMERRIADTLRTFPWLVAIDGDQIVGYAYGHEFRDRPAYRWSVETSVYVAQNAHRKGVGKALYERLLTLLKAQGFVSVMAGITLPNAASVALHEHFGFTRVGVCKNIGYKDSAWHDVVFFELQLNPPTTMPSVPLPLSTVLDLLAQTAKT